MKSEKLKIKKKQNNFGFTLIEIVIIVAVITIISAGGLSVYNRQRDRINLSLAVQRLVNDLKWARNMAMMTIKNDMGGAELEIPCGYGVSFDPSDNDTYIIFAGRDDVPGNCDGSNKYYSAIDDDAIVENIDLPRKINISNPNNFDIFFEPPDPKTIITPVANPLTVTFQIEGKECPDYCQEVIITTGGKIEY